MMSYFSYLNPDSNVNLKTRITVHFLVKLYKNITVMDLENVYYVL